MRTPEIVTELVKPAKAPRPRSPRNGTGLERRLVWLTVADIETLVDIVGTDGHYHETTPEDLMVVAKLRKALPPHHPQYIPKWGPVDGDAA